MAHEIENMMYVGATPWHGLGKKVSDNITSVDAIKEAGLDWKVICETLRTQDGREVRHQVTMRDTDKKIFGVVGPTYKPLQNSESFGFFDPFIEAGEAKYHTAGSLKGGNQVWILASLNKDPIEIAKGDEVEKFLLLSNAHDGTMSVKVGLTPIRVVCANTLALAHNSGESDLIRVKHSQRVRQNVDALRDIINVANQQFEISAEQYKFLAKKKINKKDLQKYVRQVMYPQHYNEKLNEILDISELKEFQRVQVEETENHIFQMFEKGRGNDIKSIKGTYWAAYNAVNEYLNYSDKTDDKRLSDLWFGSNKTVNENALDIALEMAV